MYFEIDVHDHIDVRWLYIYHTPLHKQDNSTCFAHTDVMRFASLIDIRLPSPHNVHAMLSCIAYTVASHEHALSIASLH
jgi:hypothetical protein